MGLNYEPRLIFMHRTFLLLVFAAALELVSCSGVVQGYRIHLKPINPRSSAAQPQNVLLATTSYLEWNGYHRIDPKYSITYEERKYCDLIGFNKFRGGEFRLYADSTGNLMLTAWYAYVPPVQFDSAEYHRVSQFLRRNIESTPGYRFLDLSRSSEGLTFDPQ